MRKVLIIGGVTALLLVAGVFVTAAYEVTGFFAGRAAYQRGYAAMKARKYESAIRDFNASLKKPNVQYWRAWALVNRAECYRSLRQPADAIEDFSAALQLYPSFIYALEGRGFAYEETRQPDLARADYQRVLQLNPNLALVWYRAGLLDESANDFASARHDFREAIRAFPNYVAAYIEAGNASGRLHDRDGAIASFEAAIQINPKSAAAFAARGRYYRRERQFDRALADLSEAIQLDPKRKSYSYSRGLAYVQQESYAQAIDDFTRVLQLDPGDELAWQHRALAYRAEKDYPPAIADFTQLIKLTQSGDAYNDRARTYAMAGQYQRAREDYGQVLGLGDGAIATRSKPLAWLLATCPDPSFRDGGKAVELALKVCEATGWRNWNDLDTLAAAEAETGNYDDAVCYEQEAIDLAVPDETTRHFSERLALYGERKPFRDPAER